MRAAKATLSCGKKTIPLRVLGTGGTRRASALLRAPVAAVDGAPSASGEPAALGVRLGTACGGRF